jgi:hypothetical protein
MAIWCGGNLPILAEYIDMDSHQPEAAALYASLCFVWLLLHQHIREEKLLQSFLWKMVHFALFLVKISINFRPGYSTLFFFPITVYISTLQKFQNFSTKF